MKQISIAIVCGLMLAASIISQINELPKISAMYGFVAVFAGFATMFNGGRK